MSDRMLTEKEKKQIVKMYANGVHYKEICKLTGRSSKTVHLTVREYRKENPVAFNFPEFLRKPWPYYG